MEALNATLQSKATQATASMDSLAQGLDALASTWGKSGAEVASDASMPPLATTTQPSSAPVPVDSKEALQGVASELRRLIVEWQKAVGRQEASMERRRQTAHPKPSCDRSTKPATAAQPLSAPPRSQRSSEPPTIEPDPPVAPLSPRQFDELTRLRIEVRRLKRENTKWLQLASEAAAARR